jgi:hypothetical protein
MKSKFVPYEKLSKKEKKALDRKKRGGWGEINPVMRVVESKKRYRRNRRNKEEGMFNAIIC